MKKTISLFTIGLLVFMLAGCAFLNTRGDNDDLALEAELNTLKEQMLAATTSESEPGATERPKKPEQVKPATPPTVPPAPDFDSQISVKEYRCNYSKIADVFVFVLKNNSDETLEITINATFNDPDGKLVGAKKADFEVVPPNHEVAIGFTVNNPVALVEYEISAELETLYTGVVENISHEVSMLKKKAIISATNNGSERVVTTRFSALFFRDEKLVAYNWGSCGDDKAGIDPGETTNTEVSSSNETYDRVEVYFTGRSLLD